MAKNPFGVIGEAQGKNKKRVGSRKMKAVPGVRQVRLATPKGATREAGLANNRASANRRRRSK